MRGRLNTHMIIRRTLEIDGNLLPRAWNALSAIPDEFLYHAAHEKRHPISAYSTSLRLISEQWLKVLDRLDELNREHNWERKETSFPDLLREYRELLYRLHEHFDACFSVLRCLCPPESAKPTIFDSQFLDKAKLTGWKQFRDAIRLYREDHIGVLVNTMKHSQGELCSIFFHSEIEFRPGYFLRDILPGGLLGPSAKLHSSGETAFSFSRDMMFHLWWLYRVGDLLADTIHTVLRTKHGYELTEVSQGFSDLLLEVIRRCAELRPEFFPDEVKKPYPRIVYRSVPCILTIEFPSLARGHRVGKMRVSTSLTVDGEHLSNKVPYFPRNM